MTETFLIEIVKQGGFAILAGVMCLLYRKDAKQWAVKQSESASAFMAFGSNTVTFPVSCLFAGGSAPSTFAAWTASTPVLATLVYDGTSAKYCCIITGTLT